MIREFFLQGSFRSRTFAWFGLIAIVLHALLRAYVKYRLNDWYGRFYDLGGSAAEFSSGDTSSLQQGRIKVCDLLLEFAILSIPSFLVHPAFGLLTNTWTLNWRMKLMKSYINRWRLDDKKLENGNQRVHEDTQRFAKGIKTCCIVVLDAILTLATFTPLLVSLGADVKPVDLPDSWLLLVCVTVAVTGIFVSVCLGWPLVHLEVENQRVEAELRKRLVLLEEDPGSVSHPVISHFRKVFKEVRTNYNLLYVRFATFSLWLGAYEQSIAILPYALAAPLLFSDDPRRIITLGKVTMMSNAFSNVFSSLNILSDRWVDVTDFLSVRKRLQEWENHITTTPPHSSRVLIEPALIEVTTPETRRSNV